MGFGWNLIKWAGCLAGGQGRLGAGYRRERVRRAAALGTPRRSQGGGAVAP
ncbi:MAG: hypothetical protein SO250_20815 [Enterocloster clostridioformis]|uniref:hypothetical protein n=1 Tax=Enterocloster clostridioformis TaxID=1531 RepID=UPI002A7FCC10|nr:hypothetical protein [Enterocloster clostridioformis]MDY4766425.1 hypothetical protein [Enterocloster clostridioformis]